MRRPIILCIMSLLVLSIVLPASASLVGNAGPFMGQAPSPTPVPSPSPSPVPVAAVGNTLANPVIITSNNDLDPVSAAALNDAMRNFAWSPVLSSDLSPFQDVKSLGGATVAVLPNDKILYNILSTIPLGSLMSGDLGWSF
jgi:hypothetical protein